MTSYESWRAEVGLSLRDWSQEDDRVNIPGSHYSPHGDIYIEEDTPSEMCKEGVDIVNGE